MPTRVFIDTEFHEHRTPVGGNAVDIISLGALIVSDDESAATGYYAENALFDWESVPHDHWLQENVRPHLDMTYRRMPNDIATQVESLIKRVGGGDAVEFWSYFADYDWVAFCGLYGRMVDLPPEYPRYCLDLKQEMKSCGIRRDELPSLSGTAHNALDDATWHHAIHRYITAHCFKLYGGSE